MKPTKGVDLYLCPCHGKAAQILAEHLPKEYFGSLPLTGEAPAIGVVVWQRPHGSTRIPTRRDGSNCLSMPISRKQQAVIASSVPLPSQLTKPPSSHFVHSNEHHRLNEDEDESGAVPLGFRQCGVKHVDDLPEYNICYHLKHFCQCCNFTYLQEPAACAGLDQVKQPDDKYSNRCVSSKPCDENDDQVRQLVHKYDNRYVSSQPLDDNNDDLLSPDQVRQLVHKYGDTCASAQSWDGNDDDLRSSDQVRQLVHKYGDRHASAQPWNGNGDDLQSSDQVRQLVQKYGNRYVSEDGNGDDLWPPDQVRQLVHKYGNRYDPAQPWHGNDDDLRPPRGQVRQLVHRYGNMCSAHPWDGRDDDLQELFWDPIQSGHERTWHPQPLLSPTEHDQERDHYYHRRRHLQEHFDGMPPEDYIGPERHVMAAQRRWDYERLMHPAETRGWRSSTHRHFTGMPVEPMQDFVRQPYFGVEPETWWRPGPCRRLE